MAVLTVAEAAKRLRTTRKTISKMVNSGYLPAIRHGSTTRIDEAVIVRLLGAQTSTDTEETEAV